MVLEAPPKAAALPRVCDGFASSSCTKLSSVWGSLAFREHDGNVCSLAVMPDGKRLLTGSAEGKLTLWELSTGDAIWSIHAHRRSSINALAVSPDGTRALTGGWDGMTLWGLDRGEEIFTSTSHQATLAVAFSPDGSRALSSGSEGTVRVWDLETLNCVRTLKGHDDQAVYTLAWSKDGHHALSGSQSRTKLWNVETGEERDLELGGAWAVRFLPDGKRAFMSWGSGYRIWKYEESCESGLVLREGRPLAVSPDGTGKRIALLTMDRKAAGWSSLHVSVWDVEKGTQTSLAPSGHPGPVRDIVYTEDGKRVLSLGQGEILVWDAQTGSEIATVATDSDASVLSVSSDGHYLVAGSKTWDLSSRALMAPSFGDGAAFIGTLTTVMRCVEGQPFTGDVVSGFWKPLVTDGSYTYDASALTRDGKRAFFTSSDGKVRYASLDPQDLANISWETIAEDAETHTPVPEDRRIVKGGVVIVFGRSSGAAPYVRRIAPTLDGKRLVVASTKSLSAYDVEGKKRLWFTDDVHSCARVAVSPDGKLAAIGDWESSVSIVSIEDGKEVDRLDLEDVSRGIQALAFSPDGKRLLIGTTLGPILGFDLHEPPPAKAKKAEKAPKANKPSKSKPKDEPDDLPK
ncbi:WD40 repeat domain-containing protein [bacterium]|nr:WD40 repeat domain-containing protein [bacterium]